MFVYRWVAAAHLPQNSSRAVAGVASMDMDATCSSLVADVDILAYNLEQACGVRILDPGIAWPGSHIHPPLLAESGSFGSKSILAVGGCSADSRLKKASAIDYSRRRSRCNS